MLHIPQRCRCDVNALCVSASNFENFEIGIFFFSANKVFILNNGHFNFPDGIMYMTENSFRSTSYILLNQPFVEIYTDSVDFRVMFSIWARFQWV